MKDSMASSRSQEPNSLEELCLLGVAVPGGAGLL